MFLIITFFIHIPEVQCSIMHIQTRSTFGGKKRGGGGGELKSKRKTTLILVFETSKFGQRHLSATDFIKSVAERCLCPNMEYILFSILRRPNGS